jgi:hypothetical protein
LKNGAQPSKDARPAPLPFQLENGRAMARLDEAFLPRGKDFRGA